MSWIRAAVILAVIGLTVETPSVLAVSGSDPITTIAGTGAEGSSGDGGPAKRAALGLPRGIAVDAAGNVFVADSENHRVRKISLGGLITTVVGTGMAGFSGDGALATQAQLNTPRDVAVDASSRLYISDSENHAVRLVSAAGLISTVAGTGLSGFSGDGGPAVVARLREIRAVAIGPSGKLYISDHGNHRVRTVDHRGVIRTVVGIGAAGFAGDGGQADAAKINLPEGVVFDTAGNLYLADEANHRVRRVTTDGVITTVVGTGVAGFSGDGGPALRAQLNEPEGLAFDAAGNLYIADTANHRVRRLTPAGMITTVAGVGGPDFSGDGGAGDQSHLHSPIDVDVDAAGNLYIADLGNRRIRVVANALPRAAFTATPPSGASPLWADFDASGSFDRNGRLVAFSWDFGDGRTGSGRRAAHAYPEPGRYVVTLTVADDGGAADSATTVIVVTGRGRLGARVPRCTGVPATIVGSDGPDTIVGTPDRDVIVSLGGSDTVRARGGDDLICLGTGDDRAWGGPGSDRIFGRAGADELYGQAGRDRLVGGAGEDRLSGRRGDDVILGGPGSDRLMGGPGDDLADGGPGKDSCVADRVLRC